jgi:RHS repeat-associated protein
MQNNNQPYTTQFYPEDKKVKPVSPKQSVQQQPGGEQSAPQGKKNDNGPQPIVQLPKGGGAIKGIGEKFEANPVTGTASISVPVTLSSGRQGFTPQLALSYDSGSGNGPYGLGWNIGLPSITRKTDKGLPQYDDANESDVFILSGAEDLVPVLEEIEGEWQRKVIDEENYVRYPYRTRTEGLFAKIEKWIRKSDRDTFWRATTKDNITTIYGKNSSARIFNPNYPENVFQWLIEYTFDSKGNVILYEYKQEDNTNITNEIYEKNRLGFNSAFNNKYLKKVYYGNASMFNEIDGFSVMDWHFELVLDYGEHDPETPMPDDSGNWNLRLDPFSTFRAGFEIRTYRLCKRLLMFHKFTPELGSNWVLVKSAELEYSTDNWQPGDPIPALTTLLSVTHKGFRGSESKSYPPVTFIYSEAEIGTKIRSLDVDDLENLPAGVDTQGYRWIDLFGEGLNGILIEKDNAWYYKSNDGNRQYYDETAEEPDAELAPMVQLSSKPAVANRGSRYQIGDLDGNGQSDIAIFSPQLAGYQEMDKEGEWNNFIAFKDIPNINFEDPQLKMIDLTGDGHADVLITENSCFTTYYSKAKEGYEPAKRLSKEMDENKGPNIVFNDGTQTIFTADMSGDGLTDIVRIRNGSVDYWPNLGYGRFGQKVSMKNAPQFDYPDLFNPGRIRLADVDGTGTTDIIYLASKRTYYWKNLAGNSFSEGDEISLLPPFDGIAAISVMDLMGNGTSCIVWSSSLPGSFPNRVQYLELTNGIKPYVMTEMNNNMGAVRKMYYSPSTKFYLRDKKSGNPWITRLPFPVHVLEKVETIDEPTNTIYTNRYAYHHGYFDGIEREFRGFGMVEQWDTDYLQVVEPGTEDQAPVYTKTWFHTGFYMDRNHISTQYKKEYFDNENEAWQLPDTVLPEGLPAGELAEACRVIKGSILRQEVYGLDGTEKSDKPYSVQEKTYEIKRIQPKLENKHAVFHVVDSESISLHYERNTDDPRIQHQMSLETDEYGNILKAATIAYPRLISDDYDEQDKILVKYDVADFINEPDDASFYRIGVPYENKSYQVYGLADESIKLSKISILVHLEGLSPLEYHEQYTGSGAAIRELSHTGQTYYNEACSTELSSGEVASHGLPYFTRQKGYTQGLLDLIKDKNTDGPGFINNLLDNADLAEILTEAGNFEEDTDGFWQISERQTFDINNFFNPVTKIDPFGNTTTIGYDNHFLLIGQVIDAENNETNVTNDYLTLQPYLIEDINNNFTEVAFDALGMVVATAVKGKDLGGGTWQGDNISKPTVVMEYDLDNWKDNQLPVFVHTSAREKHKDVQTNWLQSYTYSDGLGRELQTKVQAEDGLAWHINETTGVKEQIQTSDRWTATGRTIYNNKGKVIKQYEPWFSTISAYEPESELTEYGVTPVMYYDPAGRLVRTILPDENEITVEFDAWQQKNFDQNDNNDTTAHFNTPQIQHYDSLGRLFLTQDDNGVNNSTVHYETRQRFDILGNVTSVQDAKERWMTETIYNMLREPVYTFNIDSGRRWILNDVAGKPLYRWDNRQHQFRYEYDHLQRPVKVWFHDQTAETLVEKNAYGIDPAHNVVGKLYTLYDQSGVSSFKDFDFKGNLLLLKKQMCVAFKTLNNWNTSPALNATVHTQEFTYDVLNRMVTIKQPENSRITYLFNKAGLLETVKLKFRGGVETTHIQNINYNEKGQRIEIYFGNNSKTNFEYHPLTFRLMNLVTTRNSGADTLQDLTYTYDPVGNITDIYDDALDIYYFNNQQILPQSTYTYDSLYRLTIATGRELNSLSIPSHADFVNNLGIPYDGSQMHNYTHNYQYDELGNILQVQSVGGAGWTRNYFYNTDPETDNNFLLRHEETGPDIYAYDAHGNMTQMPHLQSIGWDYADRMSYASLGGGGEVWYIYNAAGERVRKVIEGVVNTEERLYLGGYEIYTKKINGVVTETRETILVEESEKRFLIVDYKNRVATYRYQYDNHLGSACLELDHTAAILSYEEYHPFGTTSYRSGRTETEVSLKRYKYIGKERDNETGLYYYGARYYADWLCRFVSVDPMAGEFPYISPYNYCLNNPVRLVDPDGLAPDDPPGAGYYAARINTRYAGFAFWNPTAAVRIGFGVTPGATNISTNSTRFATRGEVLYGSKRGQEDRGSENGAFRHALWQATITSEFDRSVAAQAGNAHEENAFADLSIRVFDNINDADETVDLLNNIIGRNICDANSGANMNDLANLVLDEFYNNGLFTATENKNGNWVVSKTKLSPEKYSLLKTIYKGLNENGRTAAEQNAVDNEAKQNLEQMQLIWGTMK